MKAVRFHAHGDVDVLRYEDVPEPQIGPTEVLVRVRACALNHLDLWLRRGLPGRSIPLPRIVGSDIAGEIAEVGSAVTRVTVGQRVLISPGLSCGQCPACLDGRDNFCPDYEVIGSNRSDGGYAEYVKVPEVNIVPIPDHISFEEAAAFPLVFLTAWHMLVTRAGVRPGETVLVIAAGSGVGMAAIQIAKLFGARVLATAGTEAKLEKAKALGADEVINHSTQDLLQEVKRLTERRGVDIVIEHVGTAVFEKCVLSLVPGGRLVTCGVTSGYQTQLDIRYLFSRQLSLLGSFMGSKGELLEAFTFFVQGRLKPVIDRVFPLEEAAAAQRRMEERGHFGKILLKP
ncbi:MAG: zinc-binding dehydrogenase [Blastocatellia bacterium]|nr:zinc-binding dehydrogenase [Blastocatellia bacterium]MCX7753218.1 zinc-binding dehydrogenase [Blastocatellia bacterium]MDW8168257.1 zinc-binding dehydrogenase [Acidobacteriota bacterium]